MKRSATYLFWKLLLPKIMRGCPCGRQRRYRKRIDEYENRRQVVKGGRSRVCRDHPGSKRSLDGFGRCASSREPAGVLTPHTAKTAERKTALPFLAEGEGFEPPDACTSTVFKFYPSFVACCLLLLFNNPNCRKISGLTTLLSDNPGFLSCLSIISRSLAFLIFSAFLTAFCRDFVDDQYLFKH